MSGVEPRVSWIPGTAAGYDDGHAVRVRTGTGAADDRRREATLHVGVTGRRMRAARVGRRWADIRGPLLAAATLALIQAGARLRLAPRRSRSSACRCELLVPIVAVSTLAPRARGWGSCGTRSAPSCRSARRRPRDPRDRRGLPAAAPRGPRRDGRADGRPRHASRLGYGAVAVTDRARVLAHAGSRADHHGAGTPRAAGGGGGDGRAPCRAPAGRLGPRLRRPRLPVEVGRGRADRDAERASVGSLILFSEGALNVSDRDRAIAQSLSDLLSTELQVGELDVHAKAAAKRRAGGAAGADRAALPVQRAEHDRRVLPHAARRGPPSRARVRGLLPLVAATAGGFVDARGRAGPRRRVPGARGGALRRLAGDRASHRTRARCRRSVPPFLVQPLVENAIKHGKTDRPLRVTIRADVRFGRLRVSVRDNGRGIPREDAERVLEAGVGSGAAGLGLASVRPARRRALRRGGPAPHRVVAPVRDGASPC